MFNDLRTFKQIFIDNRSKLYWKKNFLSNFIELNILNKSWQSPRPKTNHLLYNWLWIYNASFIIREYVYISYLYLYLFTVT